MASEPGNAEALCLLAQALWNLNDFEGALWASTAAVALTPDSDWAHRLASLAQRSLGHPQAAVLHARETVRLAPHLADSFRVLAQALTAAGDLSGAAAAAQRGLELRPLEAASHRTLGHVAFARDDLDVAEASFTHALSISPDDAVAHHELARVALKRSSMRPVSLADSVEGFARALAADPRQAVSRQNLVLVLRIFLARGAYFLFIAAWITLLARAHAPSLGRILGVALLVLPAGFATRFVTRLSRSLRGVLVDTVLGDRVLLSAVSVEAVSVLAAVVGAITGWPALAITAVLGALAARILVHSRLPGQGPGGYQIRTPILWFVAASLACISFIGFAAAATSGQKSPVGGVVVGAIFGLIAVGVVVIILNRRGDG